MIEWNRGERVTYREIGMKKILGIAVLLGVLLYFYIGGLWLLGTDYTLKTVGIETVEAEFEKLRCRVHASTARLLELRDKAIIFASESIEQDSVKVLSVVDKIKEINSYLSEMDFSLPDAIDKWEKKVNSFYEELEALMEKD